MCNCSANKSTGSTAPKSHTVRFPDGTSKAYRTEIEAKAAAQRRPGSTVRPG